jgi:hypothetical protein
MGRLTPAHPLCIDRLPALDPQRTQLAAGLATASKARLMQAVVPAESVCNTPRPRPKPWALDKGLVRRVPLYVKRPTARFG